MAPEYLTVTAGHGFIESVHFRTNEQKQQKDGILHHPN